MSLAKAGPRTTASTQIGIFTSTRYYLTIDNYNRKVTTILESVRAKHF